MKRKYSKMRRGIEEKKLKNFYMYVVRCFGVFHIGFGIKMDR